MGESNVKIQHHPLAARGRGLSCWVVGLALCRALMSTLWLPWIDSVFASMRRVLPENHCCIASSGLGESERAMLRYLLGINMQRREITSMPNCDLLQVNGLAKSPRDIVSRWKLLWQAL